MDHVAIMAPRLGLIDHILSGLKTIETRWYKNKSVPFNKIKVGDVVYFKDSGGPVRAQATVSDVRQYDHLDIGQCQRIIDEFGAPGLADIQNTDVSSWSPGKNYAILIFLKTPKTVAPFNINKTGFGSGCAWITLENIDTIRKAKPSGSKAVMRRSVKPL